MFCTTYLSLKNGAFDASFKLLACLAQLKKSRVNAAWLWWIEQLWRAERLVLTMMILKYDIVRREVRNLENMTQRAARMHIHCRFGIMALYFFFCVFLSFFIFLGLVSRHALEAEVSREGASFCHLWSQIVALILHSVQPEGFDNGVSGVLNRKTSIYQTFQNIKPRTI